MKSEKRAFPKVPTRNLANCKRPAEWISLTRARREQLCGNFSHSSIPDVMSSGDGDTVSQQSASSDSKESKESAPRSDRTDDRTDKGARRDKGDQPAKDGKADQGDKPDKADKPDKGSKPEKVRRGSGQVGKFSWKYRGIRGNHAISAQISYAARLEWDGRWLNRLQKPRLPLLSLRVTLRPPSVLPFPCNNQRYENRQRRKRFEDAPRNDGAA